MIRENKRIKIMEDHITGNSSSIDSADLCSTPTSPHLPPGVSRGVEQTPCESPEPLSEITGYSLFSGSYFHGPSVVDFSRSSASAMSGSSNGNASSSESESNFSGTGSYPNVDLLIPDLHEDKGHEGHRKAMKKFIASTSFHPGLRGGQGNESGTNGSVAIGDEINISAEISRINNKSDKRRYQFIPIAQKEK